MSKNPYVISNQTPVQLDPNYGKFIDLKQQGNPPEILQKALVDPLFTDKTTVIHTVKQNKDLTPKDIASLFIDTLSDRIHTTSEKLAKTLLSQTALNYQANNLLFKELFSVISANKAKLPMPGPTAMYRINIDVIPSCKNYLAGNCDFDTVFASFAFTFRPNVLAVAFRNENDFNSFKSSCC